MVARSTNARKPGLHNPETRQEPQNPKKTGESGGSVMVPGEIISVDEFQRRVGGISRATLFRMVDRGLRVRRDGHKLMVHYDDYSAYVLGLSTLGAGATAATT